MVCKLYILREGCFITPGLNHLGSQNNIFDILPDEIINIIIAKQERECGWCAHSRRDPNLIQCHPGCPLKIIHKGKEYIKCRYAEFKIPLDTASNRELIKKWLEMELTIT